MYYSSGYHCGQQGRNASGNLLRNSVDCLSFEKTLRQGSRVASTPDVLKSVGQEGVALRTMDSSHTWMMVGFLEEVTYEMKSDS